ncbi:MAG: PAS domain-containing protein [Acidimicrobiales bacterium]
MGDARREALTLAGVGTFRYSIDTAVATRDNPEIHDIGGQEPRILGTEAIKLVHPDDRVRVRDALLHLGTTGGSVTIECRGLAPDGTIHQYRVSAAADLDQRVIEGVVTDVTRERTAERELLTTRRVLDDFLNSVPASVIVFDEHLVIQTINEEFATALGVDASEFVGKSFFEAMPIGNGTEFELYYRKAVKTRQPVHFEFLFTPFQEWFEVTIVPVASGFISYTRSADDKKELEAIVREQETQILQGEKMRVIGQLAAGIAHDFNNQLAAVLGYADLLRSQLDDDRLRRYADRIVAAADRASALSRRILSFGDVEGPQSEDFDVERLATEVVELLTLTTPSTITCSSEGDGRALVYGDASQVQAAILNLVLNSRDAVSSDGTVHVVVSTVDLVEPVVGYGELAVGPGSYVCIEVTDSGPGMDEATLGRCSTNSLAPRAQAAALGCQRGRRRSQPLRHHPADEFGRGWHNRSALSSARQHRHCRGVERCSGQCDLSPSRSQGGTVLVVEDNELVGGLALEAHCARSQHDSGHKRRGRNLRFMRHWDEIDLVYLDWVMPGMTGNDVLQQLKTLRPDLPVIIASGPHVRPHLERRRTGRWVPRQAIHA